MVSNPHLDSLIFSGMRWAIDLEFALAELHAYAADLELRDKGAEFHELGIKQRKLACLPQLATYSSTNSAFAVIKADTTDTDSLTSSDIPKGSFAVLRLFGAMRAEDGWCSYGTRTMTDWIEQANQNRRIDGILIHANTGGGELQAGTLLRNAIAESRKPVVGFYERLGSAGVDALLPVSELVAADDTAQIGSIGVFTSVNKKMLDWYKANYDDIYSGKSPEKNAAFRALLMGNRDVLTQELDTAASFFHANVGKYRPQTTANAQVLSGAMFYAREAKKYGLADGQGSMKYALRRLAWHAKH